MFPQKMPIHRSPKRRMPKRHMPRASLNLILWRQLPLLSQAPPPMNQLAFHRGVPLSHQQAGHRRRLSERTLQAPPPQQPTLPLLNSNRPCLRFSWWVQVHMVGTLRVMYSLEQNLVFSDCTKTDNVFILQLILRDGLPKL